MKRELYSELRRSILELSRHEIWDTIWLYKLGWKQESGYLMKPQHAVFERSQTNLGLNLADTFEGAVRNIPVVLLLFIPENSSPWLPPLYSESLFHPKPTHFTKVLQMFSFRKSPLYQICRKNWRSVWTLATTIWCNCRWCWKARFRIINGYGRSCA